MSLNSTAGDSAADSYFAIADADTYFTARGLTAWTGSTTAKENAARRATQYLDNAYRDRFVGLRSTQNQSLLWPRSDGFRSPWQRTMTYPLVDVDGFEINVAIVPLQIQRAAMEAALILLSGVNLEPNLARGGLIKSQDKQVGPLRTATVWQDGASPIDRYTVLENYLRGLVTSYPGASNGNVKIVRG